MKLKESQVEHIRKSFRKMQSKTEFLALLNYAKKILYGDKYYPFLLRSLNYHSNPANNTRRYQQFIIKKKSGGDRIIHAPDKGLKAIQKCLNLIFQAIYDVSEHANGFVPGRSIVDNALVHVGNVHVYNIDLKDFFPSIDQARIWARLKHKPFALNGSEGKHELAAMIAGLCCHEMQVERPTPDGRWRQERRNVLPQGAPTSPVVTNIICQQLDYYLNRVALRFGLKYSRYADDITFSSPHFVYGKDGEFIRELEMQIGKHGFHINASKTRLQKPGFRQEVTGLVVNEKTNVQRGYVKELRKWLYYWETYGYQKASLLFEAGYTADLGYENNADLKMANVLRGKLDFLKMVKGRDDTTYQALAQRVQKLLALPVKEIVKISATQRVQPLPEITGLPILHNPAEVVKILKLFSVNDSALKFTTHSWEAGLDDKIFKDYPDFIRKAKREFNAVGAQLLILKPQLRAKILAFLFNDKIRKEHWGMHRVKFGWSSPELKDAMLKTPEMIPENLFLPEYAQFILTSKRRGTQTIQKFKQIIDIFKNEIEIRDDSPVLEELLLEYHARHLRDFDIYEFENLSGKNFYIDVDYLHKAFELIFGNIAKRASEKKIVGYRMEENDTTYQLTITNYGSFLRNISMSHEKFSLTKGDFGTISTRLNNLCDWSIETEFSEGRYRLNFLVTNPDTPAYEPIAKAEGFNYVFTFYK